MPIDSTPRNLSTLVLGKITELGDLGAMAYFGVCRATIIAWRTGKTSPSLASAQKVWDDSLLCQCPELWGQNGTELLVLLPIYREVVPMAHLTLFSNYRKYGPDKLILMPIMRTLIDEARNDLAAKVLASKSEWCLFVDSDMILPMGSPEFVHRRGWAIPRRLGLQVAFERIMSHPKEYRIVGALYRDRRNGNRAQCERAWRSSQENERLLGIMNGTRQDDGLEENGWVATGFIRIHRSVFEEMAEAAKPGGLLADIAPPPGREKDPIGFFGRTSQWRGEDVAFGRRAGMLGIKSYVDLGLYVGHSGEKIY